MDGQSSICTDLGVLIASLTFVDRIATGPCPICDYSYLYFEVYFVNGYRKGRGKEYDQNRKLVSDGYYSKGQY